MPVTASRSRGRFCAGVALVCTGVASCWLADSAGAAVEPSSSAPQRLIVLLRSKRLLDPVAITSDPYLAWTDRQPPSVPAGTVCGAHFEADAVHYRLVTFTSAALARSAGFAVTHVDSCGTCSSLQDLAVYLERPDLTAPVRSCVMSLHESASLQCLEDLGFSRPCAQTWLYDALNTRRECLSVCLWSLAKAEASTGADGRLNDCLQCDEDRSGPVFKVTAGRTRRNSGIRSSIPRRREEIAAVVHNYIPEATQH